MIHVWQVKSEIDLAATQKQAFKIKFIKKEDGSIREMIAVKSGKQHKIDDVNLTQSNNRSNFSYNLSENFLLLLNECTEFRTNSIKHPDLGTVHSIMVPPDFDVNTFKYSDHNLKPKTVGLYSIIEFNGQEVFA